MVELTLKWEKFGLSQSLHNMMESQDLVDVTVMCEGQFIKAHKNVLSACSTQFRQIFKSAPDKNPIVVLRGVNADHFKHLLQFMYLGEVTVRQDDLTEFIATADDLGVSALSKNSKDMNSLQRSPSEPTCDVDAEPVNSARSRRAAKRSNPVNLPDNDIQDNETTEMESIEVDTLMIKEEIDNTDVNEDWSNIPTVDDMLDTSDPNSSQAVILTDQSTYGDAMIDDSGPSTSQGGMPWPENPSPALQQSRRPMKRKSSRPPDQSDNDEEAPQSDTSATQGFDDLPGQPKSSPTEPYAAEFLAFEQIKCFYCHLFFNSTAERKHHVKIYHSDGPVSCELCFKVFKNVQSCQVHRSFFHTGPLAGQKHQCNICGKQFTLKRSLKYHFRNSHGDLATPKRCDICDIIFKNMNAYKSHMSRCHRTTE